MLEAVEARGEAVCDPPLYFDSSKPKCVRLRSGAKAAMINEIDLKTLWRELDMYEFELEHESFTLQEVWVKIATLKAKNELDAKE